MAHISFSEPKETDGVAMRSGARGPVMRTAKQEIGLLTFDVAGGSETHSHPEEQTFYVLEGRLRVTIGEGDAADTYEVGPGEASFHPADVVHEVEILEDSRVVSFKNVVDA